MYYEIAKNDHGLPYNPLKACVVPRPIAWISTLSKDGVVNLAPFSFSNILSYDPPYVCFSGAGNVADGNMKDTIVNAEETGEFVYNMATYDLRHQVTKTAMITGRQIDEMEAAGLQKLPSKLVKPPRVAGSPIHLECKYWKTVDLVGKRPVSCHKVVFGEVIACHIDDEALTPEGLIDVLKIRPLSRLGYKDYTSIESIFQMEKHTPEEALTPRRKVG
jgi:flavin reductase (DIM6/NTAB) family NADH-FMN oxidoreductase RutF